MYTLYNKHTFLYIKINTNLITNYSALLLALVIIEAYFHID
jgi:hypothetical protein